MLKKAYGTQNVNVFYGIPHAVCKYEVSVC